MNEEQKKFEFEFTIDREYVENLVEANFDKELTEDQWEELQYSLDDHIYPAVGDAIHEILDYAELIERNEDTDTSKSHFIVKYKHPNAYVYDWKEVKRAFKTEADANAYIRHQRPFGIDEEWKVEKRG